MCRPTPNKNVFFKIRSSIKITLCTQMQGHKGMSFETITFLQLTLCLRRGDPYASHWWWLSPSDDGNTRVLTTLTMSLGTYDVFTRHGLCRRGRPDVSTDLRMCQIPGLSLVTHLTVLASDWLMSSHWSGPAWWPHSRPAAWPTVVLTGIKLFSFFDLVNAAISWTNVVLTVALLSVTCQNTI